jgi:hypothetical protein
MSDRAWAVLAAVLAAVALVLLVLGKTNII